MNKGEYNGICNVTACTTGKLATFFNLSTNKYYCEECAKRINTDCFNQRDSIRLYGSSKLCIEGQQNH